MMIRHQLFLLATTLTILGSIGATPVRPLSLSFQIGQTGMGGGFRIDNSLIASGMRRFDLLGDDINFWFHDTDFLDSTLGWGSVTLMDESAQFGYLSFAIRASDIWENEPWAERYPNTSYGGVIGWQNGTIIHQQFHWVNRADAGRGLLYYPFDPYSTPPDRIRVAGGYYRGVWYYGSYTGQTSEAISYLGDFPTLPPEPSSVPEPSALWGLVLLGGGCWLKRQLRSS